MDDILVKQISPLIKVGLVFKGKTSSNIVKVEGSNSHVKGVQDSNNNKEKKVVGKQHQHGKKQQQEKER